MESCNKAKKFTEAELLYPQSLWAPRSSLMSAYSYYKQSYYINAIEELERFIKIYPNHERTDYAYYLLGMCHYEQIADEKKDKLRVVKLNIDENMNIPQKYGVRGIPTLLLFKKGELVDSKVGSMPKSLLNEWIESFF